VKEDCAIEIGKEVHGFVCKHLRGERDWEKGIVCVGKGGEDGRNVGNGWEGGEAGNLGIG
jgi:hypothetical protein